MRFGILMAVFALAALPAVAQGGIKADKQTAARVLLEKMGKGDFSKLGEIYGPGFVAHSSGKAFTLEDDNASSRAIRAAVPDIEMFVDRLIGESPFVTVQWRARGTNSAAGAGMPGRGQKLEVEGITIFRFQDGHIVEEWSVTDLLGMYRQLGMFH